MKGYLVLEDGSVWEGNAFGAAGKQIGEVVFNTSMTGYQEVLTDPSYCGQIVVMTYPLIGNYGINDDDFQSAKPALRGFIVKEWAQEPSNWRSRQCVNSYLEEQGVFALADIDTRALTRKIRSHGALKGIMVSGQEEINVPALLEELANSPSLTEQCLVEEVTAKEKFTLAGDGPRVVVMDFGAKQSILSSLHERGCEVVVVPATATAEEIKALEPDAIMLSNGPGDPTAVPYAIETVRQLIGYKPLFAICLGHQILALASGAKSYKLPFGHRGGNQPVKDLSTGRIYITSQNHGYVIDGDTLPEHVEISHINMNDNSLEGIRFKNVPAFSVQYHPEAGPGPGDCNMLFDQFMELIEEHSERKA
ncbi:glutamine-hydrolyzing carbamoyl-phosphate synthase small subunit [Heliorestis acidaminivorans]|uniref:Carbamoyl phosphate synthase small chain n=1 Tax=Heliorestis acidaminivorans TaxID=553427 RepID=A0A6I0F6N2_9FIRM|nr:glutamine-hydrolyzing carbamoyl-phosphate synthase small subunit [Heliorestis acidaminivorans]KAB2954487.1 glutamine-hydrolyzing carbamoyl-phosphate synthase small subunit [Heliorestis acidaminivorans]